jgi:hypothetical protein
VALFSKKKLDRALPGESMCSCNIEGRGFSIWKASIDTGQEARKLADPLVQVGRLGQISDGSFMYEFMLSACT